MCTIVGYKTKQEAMTNSEHQNDTCEFALRGQNFVLQDIVTVLMLDSSIDITEIFYVVSYCRIVYFDTFTD